MAIVLASSSPRREKLLRKIGCDFKVMISDIIEDNAKNIPPVQLAVFHARAKALDVAAKNEPDDVVIGADTIVVMEGQVYGKPVDKTDACRMLGELAGKVHEVITGVALAAKGQVWTDYSITQVKIRQLTVSEIEKYVATGEPLDKAGAYAIQGMGALLVEGITGCYTNVVGLPLVTLDNLLRRTLGESFL
jgi:septum formation protein